ncbi:GAF domain-containing protein [Umezawaea endophytica]|uniref:GAF and ANTAR domain-containing protein n=1 Tax=Umezawaea endophytica TaxID=1654476 RepID=A0A9X2VFY9_9PSEU|nr:GAF and ANTAR domain-containing protein [Umezawaea endophytica]MCS7475911.1 GAF and ANTAR domain-containing protein [Umezawaea endophytica]
MNDDLPLADELAAVTARMWGLLLSHETLGTVLGLVTSLAKGAIPGTIGAGVSLVDPKGHRTSTSATDAVVLRADALQYELDEGPCLTAWETRTLVRVDDLDHDRRWPRWTRAARPLGMRASLSAPLVTEDDALGALKVYAAPPNAYGEREEHLLTLFAAQAAVLVANVRTVEAAQRVGDELRRAFRSRDQIAMAKGVLMARHGSDENTAFAALADLARRQRKTLHDVAQSLLRTTSEAGR